jgi:hypothetical protein
MRIRPEGLAIQLIDDVGGDGGTPSNAVRRCRPAAAIMRWSPRSIRILQQA